MQVWRICRSRYADEAFTGEGARLFGGRWNNRGTRMIYTSTSLALAAMEAFVNLEPNLHPDDLVFLEAELPDTCSIEQIVAASLPTKWRSEDSEQLRCLGEAWIQRGKSVALRVPSAVIPTEWNVLLNPVHKEIEKLQVQPPLPFEFDVRMFR